MWWTASVATFGCTLMQLAFSQYRRKEIDFQPNETETNKYRSVRSWHAANRT